jgi:hypothetical protein
MSSLVISLVAVHARLEHDQADRHLALELVGDADDRALRHIRVRREHLLHPPVERRWPATLMMSSMRLMM